MTKLTVRRNDSVFPRADNAACRLEEEHRFAGWFVAEFIGMGAIVSSYAEDLSDLKNRIIEQAYSKHDIPPGLEINLDGVAKIRRLLRCCNGYYC
jgi:hypothetical protein